MRVSGFHMPRWWQAAWRARYPMGATTHLDIMFRGEKYCIQPMPCGCGYRTWWAGGLIGDHSPTLGGAIRRARRHNEAMWNGR